GVGPQICGRAERIAPDRVVGGVDDAIAVEVARERLEYADDTHVIEKDGCRTGTPIAIESDVELIELGVRHEVRETAERLRNVYGLIGAAAHRGQIDLAPAAAAVDGDRFGDEGDVLGNDTGVVRDIELEAIFAGAVFDRAGEGRERIAVELQTGIPIETS